MHYTGSDIENDVMEYGGIDHFEERIKAEKKSGGYAQGASLLLIFCELLKG